MLTINNTIDGAIQDIEIKGNTFQDPDNLADIKSVGELQEDGTYKMSILSCGKNLFDGKIEIGTLLDNGELRQDSNARRSCNYISVKPNMSVSCYNSGNSYLVYIEYDNNYNTLGSVAIPPRQSKTFLCKGRYLKFRYEGTDFTTLQLEEGTVATSYEPYQGNKCDILLPCQLEKVGDVADRIICKDGVWGVEKSVKTIKFTGNEEYTTDYPNSTYFSIKCKNLFNIVDINNDTVCIINSDKYLNRTGWTESSFSEGNDCIFNTVNTSGYFQLTFIRQSGFDSLSSCVNYVKNNNFEVKVQLVTPQFIPLPRNTQIALNSFFGTTHVYMESGEVEGTIKCKIPKSLGATVQSLNNKTDILSDRIEAIEGLKDSQNMKYETDKGYLVCKETKNGVIDDLKIEGKTLVNRTDIFNKVNPTGGGAHRKTSNSLIVDYNKCGELDNSYSLDEIDVFKSGQIYTIIIDIIQNTLNQKVEFYPMIWDFATIISGNQFVNTGEVGRKIFVIKSNKDYALKLAYASQGQATQGVTGLVEFKDIMVLDGDYTNIELPNYFEGLMSVGEDVDKIEVLSCNENLLNLVDLGYTQKGQYLNIEYMNANSIKLNTLSENPTPYASVSFDSFKFIPNIRYRLKAKCTQGNSMNRPFISIRQYENYGSGLKDIYAVNGVIEGTFIPTHTNHRIDIYGGNHNGPLGGTWVEYTDIQLSIDNSDFNYFTTHQSDKKQILFYNENGELEPIQELHEWDSIEKHSDNKWYYHKRSGKVVLNGSENWNINSGTTNESYIRFSLNLNCSVGTLGVFSNVFPNNGDTNIKETIFTYRNSNQQTGVIVICINKTKLSSQDVTGFKQWLQTNNVTAVYQLAQEEVCELAPLHLDSYANETLILCDSGAISPKMEFSITSHINELVKAYGERVNLLEEKVYKYMVTQNRMQLASTYSADSVTFKVDYFSLCGDEENYDEDLYNLILNNILVGKDNYNYDKMFTIILDYASWNQISWEQFDILVGLMDMQHNPPVEELPTEDEIEEDIIENEETPVE